MMVQGFDAADPARVSARSIMEEWGEGGSLGASQPRPQGGYGALFDWLAESVVAGGARLQLDSAVRAVEWKRGTVPCRDSFGRAVRGAGKAAPSLPFRWACCSPAPFASPLSLRKKRTR